MASCFSLLFAAAAFGLEVSIVNISLNGEVKGDFIIYFADGGDFLIRNSDLKAMGFQNPSGETEEIEGVPYTYLSSIPGVSHVLDEKSISLEITASPELLSKTDIDFASFRPDNVYYPKEVSAFLNYNLSYTGSVPFRFQDLSMANQLGVRAGELLFLSDSILTITRDEKKLLRLMTSVIYDSRQDLERTVFGDFFATSGNLGSSVLLGGISYSKAYQIDPYFIKYPTFSLSELASLPSEVEVFLDGMRIRTERVPAGEFRLENFSYYGGLHALDIVIRDPFGRQQIIRQPFYFTDALLRKGLHEFSYNIGFLREDFGIESNKYSEPAFLASHRYGLSNAITLGFRAESILSHLYNIGSQALFSLGYAGILGVSLSSSIDADVGETGVAGGALYSYQNRNFNIGLQVNSFTRGYKTVQNEILEERDKYEGSVGMGYSSGDLGFLSLGFTTVKKYVGQDLQIWTAAYSRALFRNTSVSATFSHVKGKDSSNEFFISINYYLGRDISLFTRYEKNDSRNGTVLQVQKNIPIGEGYGFQVALEKPQLDSADSYLVDSFFQYNGRYGAYTGLFRAFQEGGKRRELFQVGTSGSIAYVGRTVALGRPIFDSFGVVQVGELPGVQVLINNQEVGRTDSSGKVFVPNLSSYFDNQVSIDDRDIPINYSIQEFSRLVSPPLQGGFFIRFNVEKFQAISGMLKIKSGGTIRPVEFSQVTVTANGQKVVSPIGRGGEFYLENVKPGKHNASFEYEGIRCSLYLEIPESDEVIIDLGEVICENIN